MRDTDCNMSESNEQNYPLKNEETVNRRAWVDRALECVRRRLESGEEFEPAPEKAERPQLYVVSSSRPR